ncbi:hypothetical protein PILCRDRAFT_822589 [Piloderma croceum F 1598]|uniref:Uncharacterized protein n=1 Tax=Piloderma croceum (strain F 1598) TaxID=765440 RepID=A0A0C3FLS8_PILCF|nr:hypothetical protein PILCRDRAFT_822589 [Piloderma croceum F 1598]
MASTHVQGHHLNSLPLQHFSLHPTLSEPHSIVTKRPHDTCSILFVIPALDPVCASAT